MSSETQDPSSDLDPGRPNAHHEKGLRLLEIERFDLAIPALQQALALEPESASIHFDLGRAHANSNVDLALNHIAFALALDPEWAEPHALRGWMLIEKGQHTEAEQSLLESLRIDPSLALGYELYALLMLRTDRLEKAQRLVAKSLELDPESSSAHALLARIASRRKQGERARSAGEHGVVLEPDGEHEHFQLGATYFENGRPLAARHHFREALRIEPSPEKEAAYLAADRHCRWISLPNYYLSRVVERLPGGFIGLWAGYVLFFALARRIPGSGAWITPVAFAYLGLCIYSWIAGPLTSLWIKLKPAQ